MGLRPVSRLLSELVFKPDILFYGYKKDAIVIFVNQCTKITTKSKASYLYYHNFLELLSQRSCEVIIIIGYFHHVSSIRYI